MKFDGMVSNMLTHSLQECGQNVGLIAQIGLQWETYSGHYIQDCTTANYESANFRQEQRSDSRQSQRSLSPLSVGPIPSPIDPVQEEKAQETFDKLYEKMKNNGEVASDEGKQSARH